MFTKRPLVPLVLLALAGTAGRTAAAGPPPNTPYQVQPLLKLGDPIGDGSLTAVGRFEVGSLNDNGQLALALSTATSDTLLQYSGGTVTPLAAPGGNGTQGPWPADLTFFIVPGYAPLGMNQQGSIAFTAADPIKNQWLGVFRWDASTHQVTPVALPGMTVGNNLTLAPTMDNGLTAAINNHGEVVFAARYKGASGAGVFLQGLDGKINPVALPGQGISTGKKLAGASFPTINDAGQIGFMGLVSGQSATSALVADQGTINPAALINQAVTGLGKVADTNGTWVNSQNGNVLVIATINNGQTGPFVLLRLSSAGLAPVAAPGMAMPGGGTLKSLSLVQRWSFMISDANDAGEHAFLATVTDNGQSLVGAYRMDAAGNLSLIARTGSVTNLGVIDQLGPDVENSSGISLNSKGQVALPIRIHGMPSMVALLTPTAAPGAQ